MVPMSGMRCVVTGAASGIGKAIAEQLHARGAKLVLADVNWDGCRNVASALDALPVQCDVSDHASVENLAAETVAYLGEVDLVFANAGTILNGLLIASTPDEFEWLMGVNLRGAWSSLTIFARLLLRQEKGGRICLTASKHSFGLQHTGAGLYTASKQAVLALAEVLRAELPEKVGVTVFCPGLVSTGLADADRPSKLRQPKEAQKEFARAVQARGMDAHEAASAAIAGTCDGEFLVVTHPNSFFAAEKRFNEIRAAFVAQAPTDGDVDRYDVNRIVAELIGQKNSG